MGRKDHRKAEKRAKQRARREAKSEFSPQISKTPRISDQPSDANQATVIWSFAKFDDQDWCKPDTVDHVSFCEVAVRLSQYSNRTWAEILADRKRDHSHEPHELSTAAQNRLRDLDYDNTLYRFRFGGTQRLWGFRDRHYFVVLWWDPDHQVYPSEKKNT